MKQSSAEESANTDLHVKLFALQAAVIPLGSSVWARALSCATTVASAVIFPDAAALPSPSRY